MPENCLEIVPNPALNRPENCPETCSEPAGTVPKTARKASGNRFSRTSMTGQTGAQDRCEIRRRLYRRHLSMNDKAKARRRPVSA